jgi:hypothetical protein
MTGALRYTAQTVLVLAVGFVALGSDLQCTQNASARPSLEQLQQDLDALTQRVEELEADHAQQVRGTVDFCGPQGENGTTVHLVGRSFSAETGPSGEFLLSFVPDGAYTMIVSVPAAPPVSIPVVVTDGAETDLGVIEICPDADDDGYDASVDCQDYNPSVHPGALDECNGQDDDCNGTVDDGCPTCTDNDGDGFFAQVGCEDFVDCDDENDQIHPFADEQCNGIDDNCDGQEDEFFDLQNDPSNCGACGVVCPGGQCSAGVCGCPPGQTDCSGTCVDLIHDPQHCGECGNACSEPGSFCQAGECQLECAPLFGDCAVNAGDGCETPLNTLTDCGACNVACILPNATETCDSGFCEIDSCDPLYGDCITEIPGCETALNTLGNCGGCGVICNRPNASESCAVGFCNITSCDPGWGNCDPDIFNGCETDVLNNDDHCGSCFNDCGIFTHCEMGECVF